MENHTETDPVQIRESDHYQEQYMEEFVDKWDELIDWDARAEGEGEFFVRELKKRNVKKVLDVATGTGYHSVLLKKHGIEVHSADGSMNMLNKAFANASKRGHILRTIHADWRWLNRDVHEDYDAVICLGNSFTHLFEERDRRKALAEFYSVLKYDGFLILDQRNYNAMLKHGFSSKHTYYYAGDNVKAEPEHLDEGLARFRYEFTDKSVYHLNMFPLDEKYTRRLMKEVGFQKIQTYGDFKETYKEDEADFLVHIAEKSYDQEK
ncbi:MAG: methyltransferase domain-containing protein [Bacteroidetes bacterium]|jgi:ubiquinone/menaquinone biosynthesis C-methylase UbiE|nr:methyltransferase domain-containing protein [Bacteroidota bacterium]